MRIPEISQLTGDQAVFVLEQLVQTRRLSARDIAEAVTRLHDEIAQLQERLERLRGVSAPIAPPAEGATTSSPSRPSRRPRSKPGEPASEPKRKALSPKQKQSFALQAEYMRLIRTLPKSRRGEYQRLAKEQGREKAIEALRARRS